MHRNKNDWLSYQNYIKMYLVQVLKIYQEHFVSVLFEKKRHLTKSFLLQIYTYSYLISDYNDITTNLIRYATGGKGEGNWRISAE